jgi:hypothetical protein
MLVIVLRPALADNKHLVFLTQSELELCHGVCGAPSPTILASPPSLTAYLPRAVPTKGCPAAAEASAGAMGTACPLPEFQSLPRVSLPRAK